MTKLLWNTCLTSLRLIICSWFLIFFHLHWNRKTKYLMSMLQPGGEPKDDKFHHPSPGYTWVQSTQWNVPTPLWERTVIVLIKNVSFNYLLHISCIYRHLHFQCFMSISHHHRHLTENQLGHNKNKLTRRKITTWDLQNWSVQGRHFLFVW